MISTNAIAMVSIRDAGLDDAEAITTLINSSFRQAEEFFIDTDRIDSAGVRKLLLTGEFLLAELEGVTVGCVYLEPRHNARAYLGLLAIDPARQGEGLGSLLMDAAEDYCRKLGCRFMDINVVNLRAKLPAFYQKPATIQDLVDHSVDRVLDLLGFDNPEAKRWEGPND